MNLTKRKSQWETFVGAIALIAILVTTSLACSATPLSASGASRSGDGYGYGVVTAAARVIDRNGNPSCGVTVQFDTELTGISLNNIEDSGGSTQGLGGPRSTRCLTRQRVRVSAVSGSDGIAKATIPAPGRSHRPGLPWFRGEVRVRATTALSPQHDAAAAVPSAAAAGSGATAEGVADVPAASGSAKLGTNILTLRVWEAPDRWVDGFPLWLGRDKKADRVVVLVEGFDLYNRYSATDGLRLIGPAGDALRAAGLDILVVDFPDSHLAPDALAPRVAKAIRAASVATGGRPVAVAGLSAGGIAARWALVTAEETGNPLPVHTLVFLDTPHRGANLNPSLQAMVLKYGKKADREALSSEAAHVLLNQAITDPKSQVRWRRIGIPPGHRAIPAQCSPTNVQHAAFYARLRALNDRNGYPKLCRLVAVANSSRARSSVAEPGTLLRMWLPWGYGWSLPEAVDDQRAGSLLPQLYVRQFKVNYPLGLAGAYLRHPPTFLPAESALDAGMGEVPPFDTWYARPAGLLPLAHDRVDPGGAAFAVRELLRPDAWTAEPANLL